MLRIAALLIAGSALLAPASHANADESGAAAPPDAARRAQLVRMVRQDCGSCHGMRLTGGLGPALTPDRMARLPLGSLVATIVQGRPGTPMAGWSSLLTEAEADWIARELQAGFPPATPVPATSAAATP